MPGAATHLAIADKMYNILGKNVIKDLPLFFSGSIAPDSVHAKPNYTREDKRHTHLTAGIPTDAFHNPIKLRLFHERVNEFIANYYSAADKQGDLYLGYIIHLLADELFNVMKRTPLNKLIFTDGIDQSEKEIFSKILKEIESGDKVVLSRFSYSQNVIEILDAVWDYEIMGYVGKNEINSSKRYVMNKFINRIPEQTDLQYYSYDEAINFINYVVDNILMRLSGKSDIVPII